MLYGWLAEPEASDVARQLHCQTFNQSRNFWEATVTQSQELAIVGLLWNSVVTPSKLADVSSGILQCRSTGSVDWPKTLRLAKKAADQGIGHALIVADASMIDVVHRRMPHLKSLLVSHGIPLTVQAAVELSMGTDLFERVVRTSTLFEGLHRRYVLLRIPPETRMTVAPVVESLKRMNLKTILVAPERCEWLRSKPDEWQRMTAAGALIQLSSASILDRTDPARVRFCRQLVRDHRCHFVASESGRHHDLPISLADAFTMIAGWAGEEFATTVCHDNAIRLISNEPIEMSTRTKLRLHRWLR